jgi:hypothetical protein
MQNTLLVKGNTLSRIEERVEGEPIPSVGSVRSERGDFDVAYRILPPWDR